MTADDRDTAALPQPRAAVRGLPLYAPDVAESTVDVSENVNHLLGDNVGAGSTGTFTAAWTVKTTGAGSRS